MPNETTLHIEGMTCMMCVKHVENALKGVEGVLSAKVSLSDRRAVVLHDPEATIDDLLRIVEESGYRGTVQV